MKLSSTPSKALTAFLLLLVALSTTLVIQSSPSSAAPVGSPVTVSITKRWAADPAGATSTVNVSNAVAPAISGQVMNDTGTEDDVVIASYATSAGAVMSLTETMSAGAGGSAGQMLECTEGGDPSVYRYVMGDVAGNPEARSIFVDLPFNPAGNGVISCVLLDSNAAANPDLAVRCGINVTLVLDESNSIGTANAEDSIRNAVRSVVDGLGGTGSALRVVEFGTRARQASIAGSTGFQLVDATLDAAVETYLTTPGVNTVDTSYDPANQPEGGEGFTNWQGALALAGNAPGGGDLTVFITDGEPNTTNASADAGRAGFLRSPEAAAAAIQDLNNIKQSSHVLGIGVGNFSTNAGSFSMLRNVIEPNGATVWTGSGTLNPITTDVVGVSDYSQLPGVIRSVLLPLCAPTVEITKVDDTGQPVEGFEFRGSVDVTNPLPSDPDQYTWVEPDAGLTTDDGSGEDAPQSRTTGSNGTVTYRWAPNTNGDLAEWGSQFAFTEIQRPGWSYESSGSSCTLERTGQPAVPLVLTAQDGGPTVDFSMAVNGQPLTVHAGDHVACTIQNNRPGQPNIGIIKEPVEVRQVDATHYQAEYTISVHNDGEGAGTYSLSDTPAFGPGASVDGIIVLSEDTEPDTDISTVASTVAIVTDQPIGVGETHTYRVVVNFTVAAGMVPPAKVCDVNGAPGSGAFNRAVLTFNGADTNADACIDIPAATTTVAKRVSSVSRIDADTLSVTYQIDVRNAAGNAATIYDLDDNFTFGTGITIVDGSASASAAAGVPSGTTINPSFTGVAPNTRIVSGVAINGGDTHTYEVSVDVDIDLTNPAAVDGACETTPTTGDALTNRAVTTSGGVTDDDLACAGFSTLRLIKTVENNNGGTADADDFALTATLGNVTVSGAGDVIGVVVAGPYALSETGPTGYTTAGWTCDNLTVTNDTVPVAAGAHVVCRITNSDQPELTLTKTAPPTATLVSGTTYSVDYQVSISNAGGTGQSFTLTDSLAGLAAGLSVIPAQLEVTAGAGAPAPSPTWNGTTDTTLASGTIAGNSTYTYTVHVEFDVDVTTLTAPTCTQVPTPRNGAFNSATLTYRSVSVDASACSNIPTGNITVAKTGVDLASAGGNDFSATYTITVTNSGGPGGYDLMDAPQFGPGTTITGITVSSLQLPSDVVATTPFTSIAIVDDKVIAANAEHTYTVTVNFSVDPAMTVADRECGAAIAPNKGAFNRATITVGLTSANADACLPIPAPAYRVTKTAGTLTNTPAGSNEFTATYTITVENTGDAPGSYSLQDTPQFGPGVAITGITVSGATLPATVTDTAPFDTVDIVNNQPIGDDPHTYDVTVTLTVQPSAGSDARACSTPVQPGRGAFNRATMTPAGGTAVNAEACLNIPGATVSMVKQAGTIDYSAATNTYTASYTIVVSNNSQATGQYSLTDTPSFGVGASISQVRVTSTTPVVDVTANAPVGTIGIVADQPIGGGGNTHTYTVTVTFTVDPGMTPDERECASPIAPGAGAFNRATIIVGGTSTNSDACLPIPSGTVSVAKRVGTVNRLDADTLSVTYAIDVSSPADNAPTTYDVDDAFSFGAGISIVPGSVSLTAGAGVPAGTTLNATFNGVAPNTRVAAAVPIIAGQRHTYLVTVRVDIDLANVGNVDGTCNTPATANDALTNRASVTSNGTTGEALACANFSTLRLIKTVSNNNGGTAAAADFTLTAQSGATTVSGTADVVSVVPAAPFTLSESGPAGYASAGWTCDNVAVTNDVVTVAAGANVVCRITNSDQPTLTLQKAAPANVSLRSANTYYVDYQLFVRNTGGSAQPFTLTDSLAGLADGLDVIPSLTKATSVTPGAPAASATWNGFSDTTVATGTIPGGAVWNFFVHVEFTVDAATLTAPSCGQTPSTGNGAFNTATLTYRSISVDSSACSSIPPAGINLVKTGQNIVPSGGNEFTATYTIQVSNTGQGAGRYDLVDRPVFGDGTTITGITVSSPELTADVIATPPFTSLQIADGKSINAGAQHSYTVTVDVTVAPSMTDAERECGVPPAQGQGAFNRATITVGATETNSDACLNIPAPTYRVTKSTVSLTNVPAGSAQFVARYTIAVENTGQAAGSYSLQDTPLFAAGAAITSVTVSGDTLGAQGVTGVAPFTSVDIVSAQPIAPGATHTYQVTVGLTVDPAMTPDDRTCGTPATAGKGAFNRATMTPAGRTAVNADACLNIPGSNLSVVKDQAAVQSLGNFQFRATYRVTVSNAGDGPGQYTLVDTPQFGAGATISRVQAVNDSSSAAPSVDATDDQAPFELQVVTDQLIGGGANHVYMVTVDFGVAPVMLPADKVCDVNNAPGSGAFNGVSIRTGLIGVDDDADCAEIPSGDVTIEKVVDNTSIVDDDTISVSYLVRVVNNTAVATQYDLADELRFGIGNTVTGVTASVVSPNGLSIDATFDGRSNTTLATGVAIQGNTMHVYRVTATVDVDMGATDPNGDCITGQDGGLLNRATAATVVGPKTATACAEFSTLELRKTVVNDDGGSAGADDFTLTADGDVRDVTGTSGVRSLVPVGDYDLSETGPAGYTAGAWTCQNGTLTAAGVTVPAAADVVCAIVNDDNPIDLELTKSDDGITAVAGGDPFEYTIHVQNVGTRDADLGEPVTVIDELPIGMLWVDPAPADCTFAGQTLTCDIDPALLGVGDEPVEIVTLVRVPADVTDDALVNQAWVTTDDDPVPPGDPTCQTDCPPASCPDDTSNNVDCEETPIVRTGAVEIVKTDSVPDGQKVRPGDTYSYTLQVRNLGPATIFPGLVVNDDLPAELSLISAVGGAGWTCNTVDPVACTYAPALAPNESAPAITVTVRVNLGVNVDQIHNVATTIGTIDDDCPNTLAQAPCVVTDDDDETTPVESDADLAIVKTSNIATAAPGNAVRWQLAIVNNGPATAVNVVITDVVPASMTVIGVTSPEFSCSRTGNSVSCTVASLVPGGRGTVFIDSVVNTGTPSGTITNIGRVTSDTPDPNPSNNSDDALVVISVSSPPTTPTTTPEPPVRQPLPQTGAAMTVELLQAALVLVFVGGLVLLVTRRRSNSTPQAS